MMTLEDRAKLIAATLAENPPTSWGALNPIEYVTNHLLALQGGAARIELSLGGRSTILYSAKTVEECLQLERGMSRPANISSEQIAKISEFLAMGVGCIVSPSGRVSWEKVITVIDHNKRNPKPKRSRSKNKLK